MEHPIPLEELAPEVSRVCGPAAPAPAKLMAARGMMPMPRPGDLVTVLYMLAHDATPALASAPSPERASPSPAWPLSHAPRVLAATRETPSRQTTIRETPLAV